MQRFKVSLLSDRHCLVQISDRAAVITKTLKRPGKGGRLARLVSAYAGFDTQSAAIAFVAGVKRYFSKAYCEVRRAVRLIDCQWEVKIRYFAENSLESFIWAYAENPAIVATADMSPVEAKQSIYPPHIEPVRPVTPINAIELAPLQIRSSRPQKIGRYAIE